MGNISMITIERIGNFLFKEYGLNMQELKQMTTGVGGDTYLVYTAEGKFIYKIADANEMNHPKDEPELCEFLLRRGVPVSVFLKNKSGSLVTQWDQNRIGHLQKFVEGKTFAPNEAPDWFMKEAPVLLGRIHNELQEYKELPMGIGKDFFTYMTPENAKNSYSYSYENAKRIGEEQILEDLEFRMKIMPKFEKWQFDLEKLTFRNTHGDYTVNQIICGEDKVHAVIDWTCACRHPVVWEITRSFFLAEPACAKGAFDEGKFKDYTERYCSVAPLTRYDRDNLLKIYLYQLAVCDYYAQYLGAEEARKAEYLQQAQFATHVLRIMT